MKLALDNYPECDYVYTGHQFFGGRQNVVSGTIVPLRHFFFRFRGVCGFMWRKKCSDKIGKFDENLCGIEDWDYWLRLIENNNNIVAINEILYFYQVGNQSMSAELKGKYYNLETKVSKKVLDRQNGILDLNIYYPTLDMCYNINRAKCIAYYDLAMEILNATKKALCDVLSLNIDEYFYLSYKYDNSFIPSLYNLIISYAKKEKDIKVYLESLKNYKYDNYGININELINSSYDEIKLFKYINIKNRLLDEEIFIKEKKYLKSYQINEFFNDFKPIKFAIIPSDPLEAYEKKGRCELLRDYYNPLDFFDIVRLFSPREKLEFNKYGISCTPTKYDELPKMLSKFKIDLIRGYGSYWPVDMIINSSDVPTIISAHDTRDNFIYDNIIKVDYIIPVSHAIGDAIIKKFDINISKKFYMFRNWIDSEIFKPIEKTNNKIIELRTKFKTKYVLLLVGRRDNVKNHDLLLNALGELGDEYCGVFIGNGSSEPIAKAEKLGIKHRTYFIDKIENNELSFYYNMCDIQCNPSLSEGFGNVIIEGLMCGTAVITSNINPLNTYIDNNINGILLNNNNDVTELKETIISLLNNKELYKNIKNNARQKIIKFDKTITMREEVKIYRTILSDHLTPKKYYY